MKGSDVAEKLKVGIVGLGAIGTVHAESFAATGQAELAAICDTDAAKLAAAGGKFGVAKRFADYRELLAEDLDAVAVCVGNALHREVAVAALEAGRHVLLEKPMAMNAAEAADIAAAAEKAGRTLQVAMCHRHAAEPQVVRKYVQAGLLGRVYHMRTVLIRRRGIPGLGGWFTTKALSGGGPLIDIGVHWFDLAMWLADQWRPTRCSAQTYAKFGADMANYRYVGMWAGPPKLDGVFDVEDYATGLVRFADDATMSFEIAWAANAEDESYIDILGEKGGARVYSGKPLRVFTEHNGQVADVVPQFNANANRYHVQAAAFLAACRGEQAPSASGAEGLAVMKLIDAVYASGQAGREVQIA